MSARVSQLQSSQLSAPPQPPQPAWKGAWGGAWTVLFGCVLFFVGIWYAALLDLIVTSARLGAALVRSELAAEIGADSDLPERLATLIASAPEAIGVSLRWWNWAGVLLAAVVVVAGLGVIRRSEAARRIALTAGVGTLVLSVAGTVVWMVQVAPVYETWLTSLGTLAEDVHRQGGSGRAPPLAGQLPGAATQIVSQAMILLVQLVATVALTIRLAGAGTRAWCAGRGQAIASAGGRG